MSKEDTSSQKNHENERVNQPDHNRPFSLRFPVDKAGEILSAEEADEEEDTLRIMPPETGSRPPIQPLSLPEKKVLHDFWVRQWKTFKTAPACQNVPEKRLLEKFDSYISINIRRYLIKDWNNMFAGGHVLGEPELREEREADDLRTLTKRWGWLCKEIGFKPWPGAIDHQKENLEEVKVDVRNEPFGIPGNEARGSHFTSDNSNKREGIVLPAEDTSGTHTLHDMQHQIPKELVNINFRLMETAQAHFHEMKAVYESDVVNKEAIMTNDPRFDRRVFVCMMDEIRDMEDQGYLSSEIASAVRKLVLQDFAK